MSNRRKARVRGRHHGARHWAAAAVDSRSPAEKAAQVVGFGPVDSRAFQDAHAILSAVKGRLPPTYRGLARRLRRHPEIFAEFRAAHALDAPTDTLVAILVTLRTNKRPKQ